MMGKVNWTKIQAISTTFIAIATLGALVGGSLTILPEIERTAETIGELSDTTRELTGQTAELAVSQQEIISDVVEQLERSSKESPIAVINAPHIIEGGSVTVFSAFDSFDVDGEIKLYSWDFGDGTKSTVGEPSITHVYKNNGPYTINLIVEDNDGLKSFASFQVSVESETPLSKFFGATILLDRKVYTWTDKVYITIVAPDYNFDSDLVNEIGGTATNPIKVSTRGFDIDQYRLVETGTDTGIFTGEVILTGFAHDADGDGIDDGPTRSTSDVGAGPTNGFLESGGDDGITVSFEFDVNETVVGSALIRWNIGEVQWLERSYSIIEKATVRVVDPDMNLNPESVDNFDVDVWSDSDAEGIVLTVTETNESTGIFVGTISFTTKDSFDDRLHVTEGDTITAEYEDHTLPSPNTTADELDITDTARVTISIKGT